MDPSHATFLTAQRLARRLTGHLQCWGCEECCLYGKLLESDTGLQWTHRFLQQCPGSIETLELLTGEKIP